VLIDPVLMQFMNNIEDGAQKTSLARDGSAPVGASDTMRHLYGAPIIV
jgi:hypothetical protein